MADREGVSCQLNRARKSHQQRAWSDAYQAFLHADREVALEAQDVELLAMAAYLIGRDEDYLGALERAYNAHREHGERHRAARCAFWLGFRLLFRGEAGRANGWLGRAERSLEDETRECAERGYLLLPVVEQRLEVGDFEAAYAIAVNAAAIGERCSDADLLACARHQQGRVRLQQGRIEAGLALLDETMVTVTSGELSPLVICRRVFAKWCVVEPGGRVLMTRHVIADRSAF